MKIKKEDKNKERNVLKGSVIAIIIFDIIALFNLALQIYLKDITYSSYIVLLFSNIIVFVTYKISKKS